MKPDKHIKEELEQIAPLLSKMDKEEGFQVPFNYFEDLEDEIMGKVFPKTTPVYQAAKPASGLSVAGFLRTLLKPRFAMAIATVLIVLSAGLWFINGQGSVDCTGLACVSADEIQLYIESNIDEFDTDLLAVGLGENFNIMDDLELNQEELDDYIDDNILENFDLNTLEELL